MVDYYKNEKAIEDRPVKVTQLDYEISDLELLHNHLWIGTWHHGIIKLNLDTLYPQFESDKPTQTHLSIYTFTKTSFYEHIHKNIFL